MTGAAQVLSGQLQMVFFGQRQRCVYVSVCNVLHVRVLALGGKHLAAAEQLDLILLCKRTVGQCMTDKYLQRFVAVLAVQLLALACAPRQHEVTHSSDTPLRVPERECHTRTQQCAQACRLALKDHVSGSQHYLGHADGLDHGLRYIEGETSFSVSFIPLRLSEWLMMK